jgi:hypothetical protein
VHDVGIDAPPAVHERLDRVGDLELAAPRRLDRPGRLEDRRREHVHAHQREVGLGLLGLLDQPRHPPVVELGHAVVLGVGHGRQQDEGVRLLGAEGRDEVDDAVAQKVVAQVHDEGRVAQEGLGGEDRVGQPERLVLLDVLDRDAEARAVAGRLPDLAAGLGGDDDAHLLDPGGGHGLDAVEEDRLVCHGDELLRARVGERTQSRALPSGEDQAAHQ